MPTEVSISDMQERRLRRDSERAIGAHQKLVKKYLRSLGIPPHDMDDYSQEVFIRIHRSFASYDTARSFRRWVYKICLHVVLNGRQRVWRKREVQLGQEFLINLERSSVGSSELRWLLRAALRELSDEKRAVVVEHDVFGYSIAELSERLELPVKTLFSRLYAGRRELRQWFEHAPEMRQGEREDQ